MGTEQLSTVLAVVIPVAILVLRQYSPALEGKKALWVNLALQMLVAIAVAIGADDGTLAIGTAAGVSNAAMSTFVIQLLKAFEPTNRLVKGAGSTDGRS